MRAREFLVKEQVAAAVSNVVAPAVKQGVKDRAKDLAIKGVDQYGNVQGYAAGANVPLPDPTGLFGADQEKLKARGFNPMDQVGTNVQSQAVGRGLERAATSRLAQTAPRLASASNIAGGVLRTGTGLVGTGAMAALHHGDAGRAYGPHADYRPGREEWMRKHGYDPQRPDDYRRAMADYKQAQANYQKLPLSTRINQALNPFVDNDARDDDAIMKYRDQAVSKE